MNFHEGVPLGLPNQVDGLATQQSDCGDDVQALFAYQWAVGAALLAAALAGKNDYKALWCEHHEDYLAEVRSGSYDLIQVKTLSGENAKWRNSDPGLIKAIRRFAEHEDAHSASIRRFIFLSNTIPYVPSISAKKVATVAASPIRLRDACRKVKTPDDIGSPYGDVLVSVSTAAGVSKADAFNVLRKLEFQKGFPLDSFRESLTHIVGAIPGYEQFSLGRLIIARNELLSLVEKANSLDISTIDCFASVLASDGRPESIIRSKCITVDAACTVLSQANEDVFRYAEAGGYLQLGKAASQKNVLRKKMAAGYVGNFFDSIWLQAQGAERRLMERAITDPETVTPLIDQLAGVVLVECQNAEALTEEDDLPKRGLEIYRRILKRTEELAKNEQAKVANEPVETLRGIAGLLSGGCKFAWGVQLNEGDSDGA